MPIEPLESPFVASVPRVGLLSTFPPTLCGLATFAAALERALRRAGNQVDIVRVNHDRPAPLRRHVAGDLRNGDRASVLNAADTLSRGHIAIIQHEFGIYGGADGDEILTLLAALEVPSIVILHTVLSQPSPHQRQVMLDLAGLADRLVVMTDAARDRLIRLYAVDADQVVTIAHGATVPRLVPRADLVAARDPRPELLTWGLLGPGKGIEHTIDALALLGRLTPRPRYTVAGVTHPNVFARDGDAYRQALIGRAHRAGLEDTVAFDDTYRDLPRLTEFVASAKLVVLPYDSRDQVTSGVLVDAIAAGRPVVATAFPHAVELLGTGAGIVVPHADPTALAAAIESVLTDRSRLDAMTAEARRIAPSLSWDAIAHEYLDLADRLLMLGDPVPT